MATFKYYNIKLLPIANNSKEVGSSGYKKLFGEYKKIIDAAASGRRFHSISHGLMNDYRFVGLQVLIRDEFAHGKLIKYHHSESLTDIYGSNINQAIPPNLSAKIYEFEFAFDFEQHKLAIQQEKLPSRNQLISAICSDSHPTLTTL